VVHIGWISTEDAADLGIVDVRANDQAYPAHFGLEDLEIIATTEPPLPFHPREMSLALGADDLAFRPEEVSCVVERTSPVRQDDRASRQVNPELGRQLAENLLIGAREGWRRGAQTFSQVGITCRAYHFVQAQFRVSVGQDAQQG